MMLAGSGCAVLHRNSKKKQKTVEVRPPQPLLVGTVALVDAAGNFVLIDNGTHLGPPPGSILKAYTGTAESAELVASQVRKHPFGIADIRSGKPQRGDRVFMEPEVHPQVKTALPVNATALPPVRQTSPSDGDAQ